MKSALSPVAGGVCLAFALAFGCKATKPDATLAPPPRESAAVPQVVRVDYAESDAFDLFLETALVNAQPAVEVKTEFTKPEWGPRLNTWIAAWNASRRSPGFRARGQLPVTPTIVVDGDSIREFRLLIDGLMGRVEETARLGGHWWAEKNMRERRIALLRPYNLRFHLDSQEHIRIIFFHGDYAAYHKDVVRSIADPAEEESLEWSPGYLCSHARKLKKPPESD